MSETGIVQVVKIANLPATSNVANAILQSLQKAMMPSTRARPEIGFVLDVKTTNLPATKRAASAKLPNLMKVMMPSSKKSAGGARKGNAGTMGKLRSRLAIDCTVEAS